MRMRFRVAAPRSPKRRSSWSTTARPPSGARTERPRGPTPYRSLSSGRTTAFPCWLTDVNGTLLFWATDAEHGTELWRSDGTPAGTVLVKDIVPGPSSSQPSFLWPAGSNVFFQACPLATGCELYRTDGTESGTGIVADVYPGANGGLHSMLGSLGDIFLFAADDGPHGPELWRSDGTPDGTYMLGDLTPGPSSSEIHPLGELNGAFYFSVRGDATATLWKTDGSAAGTAAVGPMPSFAGTSASLGDAILFDASDATHGTELWRTDGTAAGTSLLLDINPIGELRGLSSSAAWGVASSSGRTTASMAASPGSATGPPLGRRS